MSVRADVDRGLVLRREISERVAELKTLTVRLNDAALKGEQVPLQDGDREGKQFLATGTRDIVPVIITSDELVETFGEGTKMHKAIAAVAGGKLESFFGRITGFKRIYDDGKVFRARALADLGADVAPKFITACIARDKNGIPKNKIVVQWDRSRPVEERAA